MTRSSRWAIGVWLALIIACAAIISRTQFSADLSAFLPRSPSPAQQVLVDQLRDGVVSRLILIGVEGDEPATLAQISKGLAAKLHGDRSFASVNNGEDTGLEKDREYLWRNRYLLSPAITPEHFSAPALREALEEDLQLLGSPAGMLLRKILPNDPTGELLRLIDGLQGQSKPNTQHGVWFSRDGKRALLIAQTAAAGYDIDAQERATANIRAAFADLAKTGPARLVMSGPGVFSVAARATIKGDAAKFSLIATVLISLMLLALYRSPRVLGLGLLPVATGALAGIAAVSLGFGSVHGITLGFGVTLIGEGVDYAIYLFTQIAPGTAPQNTLDRIWPTLRLGVLTSICGFSAMLLSGFPGLAQLGLFSIVGLVVAALVTRWVLPDLLPQGFTSGIVTKYAPRSAAMIQRAPALRYPLLLVVALAALFLVMQRGPMWNDELASLSPIPARDLQLDEALRKGLGAPDAGHLIVIDAADEEAALQASEKVAALLQPLIAQGGLTGFESPAATLPSKAAQRARQAALPTRDVLEKNLREAQEGLSFRTGLFEPFLHDVEDAKRQALLDRASLTGTSLALKLDSLLIKRRSRSTAMLPLTGVTRPDALARAIGEANGVTASLIDLKRESDQLYLSYRQEAVKYALLGAAVIVLLLLVSLRSLQRAFYVLAPLAAAVIVTTAVLVLWGRRLSIFHLVGLLLVVAVGSNYSLFFDRQVAANQHRERTLMSLLFANLATVIGFGLLSFSKVPVLNAIGSTVGLGAILSLLFAAALGARRN